MVLGWSVEAVKGGPSALEDNVDEGDMVFIDISHSTPYLSGIGGRGGSTLFKSIYPFSSQ